MGMRTGPLVFDSVEPRIDSELPPRKANTTSLGHIADPYDDFRGKNIFKF